MPDANEMPVLRIDLRSPTPVYRQILDGLRALLVAGAFKPGDKLPTVRQLAVDIGVNHNTVAESYRLLAEEGWLDLQRHHGATVRARETQNATAEHHENFAQRLQELAALAIADGVSAETVSGQLIELADRLRNSKKGTA